MEMNEGNILINDAHGTFHWRWTILIAREETRCRHAWTIIFLLAARYLLYAG